MKCRLCNSRLRVVPLLSIDVLGPVSVLVCYGDGCRGRVHDPGSGRLLPFVSSVARPAYLPDGDGERAGR